MLQNYLKIAWRNLQRKPGFTLLNIFGLAIGMACFTLILMYIQDEVSYDGFHSEGDQIYRVALDRKYPDRSRQYALIPQSYAEAMQEEYPVVEETCRLLYFGPANSIFRLGDQTYRENDITWSDSTFFDFFDIPLLKGDAQTVLTKPYSVVLTESIAEKYFGADWKNKQVIGEVIERVQNDDDYTVTGVMADVPHNSHLKFDFLVSSNSLQFLRGEPNFLSFSSMTYLKLQEGADSRVLEAQFPDLVTKYASGQVLTQFGVDYPTYQANGNGYVYTLQNIQDIYLDSKLEGEFKPPGSRSRIYFFSVIALLIIVIAGINFVNLSTAYSSGRAREVGIRKTLGSARQQLMAQFLTEAILISSLSAIAAGLLVALVIPRFNALTEKLFVASTLLTPSYLGVLTGLALLTGLAAGFYPAIFISSFKPMEVLRGKLLANTKGIGLRNVLVVFQFGISIFLVAATILIYQQLNYTENKSLGFDKESLVSLQNTGGFTAQQTTTFLQQIRDLPGVEAASGCNSMPGQFYFGVSFKPPGADEMTTGSGLVVGEDFAQCMKMELVQGREFSKEFMDTLSVLVNEAAVREMGLEDPLGTRLTSSDDFLTPNPEEPLQYTIVGVLKDYHFQSLHHEISPLYLVNDQRGFNPGVNNLVSVRLGAGNPQAALQQIERIWTRFQPDVPFAYSFMDQEWANLYVQERQARKVFILFTVLAIIIACLGLFGLAAYMVEKRRKEISIRKVLGASAPGIIQLLSQDFLKLVVIAMIIASPVAYYFIDQWLQDFAYRINIQWWVFVIAGGLAVLIALLTVGFQSLRAALANPVENLRDG